MSNVSQMKGWVIHNEGGFVKTVYIIMISPPGAYHNGKPVVISPPPRGVLKWGGGGVNENLTPVQSVGPLGVPYVEIIATNGRFFLI